LAVSYTDLVTVVPTALETHREADRETSNSHHNFWAEQEQYVVERASRSTMKPIVHLVGRRNLLSDGKSRWQSLRVEGISSASITSHATTVEHIQISYLRIHNNISIVFYPTSRMAKRHAMHKQSRPSHLWCHHKTKMQAFERSSLCMHHHDRHQTVKTVPLSKFEPSKIKALITPWTTLNRGTTDDRLNTPRQGFKDHADHTSSRWFETSMLHRSGLHRHV
jgi:hypothetical protein